MILTFLKERIFLIILLLVFIYFKIPHLHYPFYWDESWPYVPAIKQMYAHGISLMPTAVDAELSRGHPLFFHAAVATWMKIFGSSHEAMHSFALVISVLFLIALYEIGLRLFNKRVAILSVLLVSLQVVFFIQSSFVLFEVLIAFLAFLSLYFYTTGRYVFTMLTLTALFYTKESGLIVGAVLGIDALIGFFNNETPLKKRLWALASVGVPCVLIGVFFLVQKHLRGWYVFPFYSDLVEHSWNNFFYKYRMACVRMSFIEDKRYLFLGIISIVSVITSIKNRSLKYLILIFPAVLVCILVSDQRAAMFPAKLLFVFFNAFSLWALYVYSKLANNKQQQHFIMLTGCFVLAFLIFSAMNFFSYRYLLADIVPSLFLTAVFIDFNISRSYKVIFYPVVLLILFLGYYSFSRDQGHGDSDFGAFNGMTIEQDIVDYLVQHNAYDSSIGAGGYLNREHLIDPNTGFLRSEKAFSKVQWDIKDSTVYAVFDNIEPDDRYEHIKNDTSFQLVQRFAKGDVWAEIYKRK